MKGCDGMDAMNQMTPEHKRNLFKIIMLIAAVFLVIIIGLYVIRIIRGGGTITYDLQPSTATLVATDGILQTLKAGSWDPLSKGASLAEGDLIQTGRASRNVIRMNNQNNLRLADGSQIYFQELKKDRKLDYWKSHIRFDRGRLWVVMNKQMSLVVETPNAIIIPDSSSPETRF